VTGNVLKDGVFKALRDAQSIRNKVTHGQDIGDTVIWKAVAGCLRYTEAFNQENLKKLGFNAFGSLQGVTSSPSKSSSSAEISELALRGLGFKFKVDGGQPQSGSEVG
jgi:hypothetical protein